MNLFLLRGCCSLMEMKMIANGFFFHSAFYNQCFFNVCLFFVKFRCDSLLNSVSSIGMYVRMVVYPFFHT